MAYGNGIASYLAGPGGRFDLSDPSTQAMVKDVMGSPANAPKYGISLQEVLQLHNLLNRISVQTPQPKPTTVVDELKMAAFQAVQSPNAVPPQAQQMPPQGIQQAMPQPQMPAPPMDQGLGGMPTPALDNAEFAGGGIVAFADTGLVGVPPGAPSEGNASPPGTALDMFARIQASQEAERAASAVPTQEEEIAAARAAREAAGITGKLGEERLKKLEADKGKDAEAEARSERFALAKAGFKMAEAASRRGAARTGFLGAAAEGATAGLTDYAASQEKLRALQAERDKEIASIQNLQRAEDLGFVKDASGRIEKAKDRLADLNRSIYTTQTTMAGQMAAVEGRQAEITARAEEGRLNRAAQERLAGIQIDAQRKLEELRQAGNVDASMLADYNKAMAAPETERAAALKAWEDKYSKIQRARAEGRTPEKTFAAEQATLRKINEAWANEIITRGRLKNLQRRADNGDVAADEELAREKEKFAREYMSALQKNTSAAPTSNAAGGQFTVTAPNGQVFSFPSQAAADRFKAQLSAQ